MGADFSDVRIHADARAAESAAAISAEAYTVGNEVVFGRGFFAPDSLTGKSRLAHELTHVQQQRKGEVPGTDAGNGVAVSDPSDSFEHDAETAASRAVSAHTRSQPSGAPAMQPSPSTELLASDAQGYMLSRHQQADSATVTHFISQIPYVQRAGPATVTVPASVPSGQRQISGNMSAFNDLMKEAKEIIEGTRKHYTELNNNYAEKYKIYKEVATKAKGAPEDSEFLGTVLVGAAAALGTGIFPKIATAIKEASDAVQVKSVVELLPKTWQIAAEAVVEGATHAMITPPGGGEASEAGPASPSEVELVGLQKVDVLQTRRDDISDAGHDFYTMAVKVLTRAMTDPSMSADADAAVAALNEVATDFMAQVNALMEQLLRPWKSKVDGAPTPNKTQCEKDIWIAHFGSTSFAAAVASASTEGSKILVDHLTEIGLLADLNITRNTTVLGTFWESYQKGERGEDEEKLQSVNIAPHVISADEAFATAAARLPSYWKQVLLQS